MSSRLTGRKSRKTFSLAFLNRIMKYQKSRKKITSKIYNQLTGSEPNWLLLVQSKINPSKISDFPAVTQKEGDKRKRCWNANSSLECFFIFRKITKFLCDHRNNGNRHRKELKIYQVTNATMAQTAARKSHNLKVVRSSLTGRSAIRLILLALYPTIKVNKKEIFQTKSITNWSF